MNTDDIKLSKSLSWLLRHGCEKSGLKLMPGGFLNVADILELKQFQRYSQTDIERVVCKNNKQRFFLDKSQRTWKIRANQGHSIQVDDLELQLIKSQAEAPVVIHGTYINAWNNIKKQGLCRMKRNHIHFSAGHPDDDGVISGMRQSCDVWIYIDVAKALSDGIIFYRSTNNVILSPGDASHKIDPFYFLKAIDRKSNETLKFDSIKLPLTSKENLTRRHPETGDEASKREADVPDRATVGPQDAAVTDILSHIDSIDKLMNNLDI